MFTLARDLGMTVHELMTGEPGPLMTPEAEKWRVFYVMEAEEKAKREKQRANARR